MSVARIQKTNVRWTWTLLDTWLDACFSCYQFQTRAASKSEIR